MREKGEKGGWKRAPSASARETVAECDHVVVLVGRDGLAFRENEAVRCGENEERRTEARRENDGIERGVRTSASQNSPSRGLLKERDKVREREEEERSREEREVAEEAPCLSPSFEPLMLFSS